MATFSDVAYYTTTQSDTYDLIAFDLYGNEFLASDIASLNPEFAGELVFEAGVELKVPVYDADVGSEAVAPWRRPS